MYKTQFKFLINPFYKLSLCHQSINNRAQHITTDYLNNIVIIIIVHDSELYL